MKSILLFLILLVSSIQGFSQIDTSRVSFVSYWSKGDSYDFKVTKVHQQWREGKQTKNDSTSYIANFTVLDSTATSYTIRWRFKTNLTGALSIPEKMRSTLAKYPFNEIVYQTSEVGAFVGIQNWEAIAKMMKSLFADVLEISGKESKVDKQKLQQAMQPLIEAYSSKEGIEQLVFKELQNFHFPLGAAFPISEPVLYEEQLPNMFGGDPIRGDAKIYVASLDTDNSFCVLKQEMKLNPDDTRKMINQWFQKMQLENKQVAQVMQTAQYDIRDTNYFEYYYYPGIPIKIETVREAIINIDKEKALRIDKTRIELMD